MEKGSDAVVEVANGTYLVTSTLSISRNVTIQAADGATVVLDGEKARQVIDISAGQQVREYVRLVGLSITRGDGGIVRKQSLWRHVLSDALIRPRGKTPYVPTGLIEAWHAVQGGGFNIEGGTVTLYRCTISDNYAGCVSLLLLFVALNPAPMGSTPGC